MLSRWPDPAGDPRVVTAPQDFENLIFLGTLDVDLLMLLVPRNVQNTWTANPNDRIQRGFKFVWDDPQHGRYEVHGHEVDPDAFTVGDQNAQLADTSGRNVNRTRSNAAFAWVVRVKHQNKQLLMETTNPPVGQPSNWTRNARNESLMNATHIPFRPPSF